MRNEALVPGQPATSAPAPAAGIAGPPAPAPAAAQETAPPPGVAPAPPARRPARSRPAAASPARRRPPRPPAAPRGPRKPPPPAGLREKGLAVWRAVVDSWELDPDGLLLLSRICHVSDRIAALDTIAAGSPAIIRGSHGGQVAHPALVELRQQELVLARLIKTLALPDLPPGMAQGTGAPLAIVRPIGSRSRRSHRAG